MQNTETPVNEIPDVTVVRNSLAPDATVHLGKRSGASLTLIVTACNGRTMSGFAEFAPATEVTCKRCRKLVTA